MLKEGSALAATDDFAYLVAEAPGSYPQNPNGCAGNNVLVIFNAKTGTWNATPQEVTSSDKLAWQQARGISPTDPHTCNGTGSGI